MSPLAFPDTTIHRNLDILIKDGLCHGSGRAHAFGEFCAVQAVYMAEHALTPSPEIGAVPDRADSIANRPRDLAVSLNDRGWSSAASRAAGMRDLLHALVGSKGIDEKAWAEALGRRYIKEILPIGIKALGSLLFFEPGKAALLAAAGRCEEAGTPAAARSAADVIRAATAQARLRPNPYKNTAAGAAEAAEAAGAAWAAEAAGAAWAAWAAEAAEAAGAAWAAWAAWAAEAAEAAPYSAKWWEIYNRIVAKAREEHGGKIDAALTRCAVIAAEELELSKAARDVQVRQ
jgi:hypothetical protein